MVMLPVQNNGAAPIGDEAGENFDNALFYMNDHSVRKCQP
jgi:hypothetical protein